MLAQGAGKTVKTAINPIIASNLPMMIAIEKGYFKEAGVKVAIEELDSSANVMALLAQGQLQIIEGGISVGYFNAIERGVDFSDKMVSASTQLNSERYLLPSSMPALGSGVENSPPQNTRVV